MNEETLIFKPLYYEDRLKIINPRGCVGVVTLWSTMEFIYRKFKAAGIDLNPDTSSIVAFGNLYGNGLRELLRNLLYNPQIRFLVVCGRDRSGSKKELIHFFKLGTEPCTDSKIEYLAPEENINVYPMRIKGTKRIIDSMVTPSSFKEPPEVFPLGDLKEVGELRKLCELFEKKILRYPCKQTASPRIAVPLPQIDFVYYPSNPRSHVIIAHTPLEAWKEIIFRICRFGHPVVLAKGERIELQNLKVVVENPVEDKAEDLEKFRVSISFLRKYRDDILSASIEADETYNYGNRIRAYFGVDCLDACVERLKEDREDRKSFVSLWDTRRDLTSKHGHPCLVSLFFRLFNERLTVTATFRTHNALDAWLVNFYGLMGIQRYVAERTEVTPGAITVFSHSIAVDKKELARAEEIAGKRKYRVIEDPNGYFRITVDEGKIIVEHCFEDIALNTYEGKKASGLQQQLVRDLALSEIGHAIYLGRQLQKAEQCLRNGEPYIQD